MIGQRKNYKGSPQGGILSLLLYALYVKYIENIWEPRTKKLQYADDVAIYVEKFSLDESCDIMRSNMDRFHEWLKIIN